MAHGVCPWWLGYALASPLRKLLQDPDAILRPYLKPGMVALDIGSGMGFFSLPMARLVAPSGKVIAVDLQEKMLASLRRRARRQKLDGLMEFRVCPADSLGIDDLAGKVDFALTFAVLHEMPKVEATFSGIYRALAAGGKLLAAEPTGHVTPEAFELTIGIARKCGFSVARAEEVRRSHTALLVKST
jgi:ubiquinone/menaquinone biosynthesis C-methylase UbiE